MRLARLAHGRDEALRPTPETKAAFAFTMVEAANRHGIDLIAVTRWSTTGSGRLSEFLRDFHGVMGLFGSWLDEVENTKLWSAQESEAVENGRDGHLRRVRGVHARQPDPQKKGTSSSSGPSSGLA